MRKKLIIGLILCVILFSVGCSKKTNEDENKSGLTGVSMYTVEPQYPSSVNEINVVWENNSDKELTFGDVFTIQKYDGKEWNPIGKEAVFNSIGYVVSPHTEVKHSYNIRVYSDKLEKGKYRIVTNYLNVHSPGNYDTYNISANFTVE